MSRMEKRRIKKRKQKITMILFLTIIFAITAIAVYLNQAPKMVRHPQEKPKESISKENDIQKEAAEKEDSYIPTQKYFENRKDGFYTILLAGTMDEYNTDSIMLISVDVNTRQVNAISIPRDTMVDVPRKNKKINATYGVSGVEELRNVVEDITGIYTDYYIVVNVESFMKIIDLIGGVEFDVPYNMYHKDDDPEYTINLKSGVQTLNGSDALKLVRYRGTAQSDIERMNMQRQFLKAVGNKILQSFTIKDLTKMVPIVISSIETDMSAKDMLWFYRKIGKDFDSENNLNFYSMPMDEPGRYNGQEYVYLNWREVLKLVNTTVNSYQEDITGNDINIIRLEN